MYDLVLTEWYQHWVTPDVKTVRSSETLMPVYQTARRQIRVFLNVSLCNVLCPTYTEGYRHVTVLK
jgi:hypothetical protein